MSTSTYFKLLNANDPKFLTARDGTPEEKKNWEEDFGPFDTNPGAPLYPYDVYKEGDFIEETDEEYGGWLIDLSKLPKEATHIKIERF